MKTLMVLTLSLFCFANVVAQWQTEYQLTTNPSYSYLSYNNAYCIASEDEKVFVAFWDSRDGSAEIYYIISTDAGNTWLQENRLTDFNGHSEYPSTAISANSIHVVWCDDREVSFYPELYYKRSTDNGLSWSTDLQLTSNPSDPGLPSMAVKNNDVHVVWHDLRDGNWEIYYKRSNDNGITWQPDLRLTDNTSISQWASISASGDYPDEKLYVTWQDERDGKREVYFKKSTDAGTTWSEDIRLTSSTGDSENPVISVQGDSVVIVWTDNRNGTGNGEIYFKSSVDAGITWSEDIRVTNTPVNSSMQKVILSSGIVHISWNEVWEIYYIRSTDFGETWEPETRITNNPAESKNSFLSVSNTAVHLLWQDRMSGNDDIYYKKNPTGNSITSVRDNSISPFNFSLEQNYPNPFNPSTKIRFTVGDAYYASPAWITLKVYDILGNEVTTLVNEYKPSGSYEVEFDLNSFNNTISSGIYFFTLETNQIKAVKKMILLK